MSEVNYIFVLLQKIKNEKIDDEQELRAIFKKMSVAFSSVITFLQQQLNELGMPAALNFNFVSCITFSG